MVAACLAVGLAASLAVAVGSPADLVMGNPSGARASTRDKDNFLMDKAHYALSYNNTKATPNWVSWCLTKNDIGQAARKPFHPDESLPRGFTMVTPEDYNGGGFDRGHMCPHSDRSADDDMSNETFLMSNMIPQSANVNQKAWDQLESYCRDLVEHKNKVLYIVDGPAGVGGTGKNGTKTVIGHAHRVTVPAQCWKVIMVLDAAKAGDPAQVDSSTRLIAVIMPNDMTVGEDWASFRVPVRDVEALTGYKFFDRVPSQIIEPLKQNADTERIPKPRHIKHGNRA